MGPSVWGILFCVPDFWFLLFSSLCLLSALRVNHVLCMTNRTKWNTSALGDNCCVLPHFYSTTTFAILTWCLCSFNDLCHFPRAPKQGYMDMSLCIHSSVKSQIRCMSKEFLHQFLFNWSNLNNLFS